MCVFVYVRESATVLVLVCVSVRLCVCDPGVYECASACRLGLGAVCMRVRVSVRARRVPYPCAAATVDRP